MLFVASTVQNLSDQTGTQLDGYNSKDCFLPPVEPASPFPALFKQPEQPLQLEERAQYGMAEAKGPQTLNVDDLMSCQEIMSSPSSSLPTAQSRCGEQDTVQSNQVPAQNGVQRNERFVHSSTQKAIEETKQEPYDGCLMEANDTEAEQTSALLRLLDSPDFEAAASASKPKRNRERASLGIPPSTSSLSGSISVSSAASPSRLSSKPTTRQMSLRGARKRLSVLPGSSPSASLPSPFVPQPVQPVTSHTAINNSSGTIPSKIASVSSAPTPFRGSTGPGHMGDRPQRGPTQDYGAMSSYSPSGQSRSSSASLEQEKMTDIVQSRRRRRKTDDDDGYGATHSQTAQGRATSRQGSAAAPGDADSSNKRTRSPSADVVKKIKVQDQRDGYLSRRKKMPSDGPREEKKHVIPKGLFSVTGDEYALKHNNDYCESCMGLGEFICCDSCPRAFHFSCCQPPMDPQNLPDEWNCNECRAVLIPPEPNPPGIFQRLLDAVDRMNPRAFSLPSEIRTFFRGVETNSDGEYVDMLDYKPSETTSGSGSHVSSVVEDPLQLRDKHGGIRICFHCNKSAWGGRMMISCEHCPLHWHLDCLNPPLASRPPTTRKWMCPNHVDHVLPRRRKRRNALPVEVVDPFAPNDGDIEIIEEAPPQPRVTKVKSTLIHDPTGAVYRIPEKSIRLSFVEKCRRLQMQAIHDRPTRDPPGGVSRNFEILVAAVMACEGIESEIGHTDKEGEKSKEEEDEDEEGGIAAENVSYERMQDAVLAQIGDPEERDAYIRFRALQRAVCEKGLDESAVEWSRVLQQHQQQNQQQNQQQMQGKQRLP